MAGSYPDVPGRRMAYDADGTVGIDVTPAPAQDISPADMAIMNNEENSETTGVTFNAGYVALLFPELRELDGIFAVLGHGIGTPVINIVDSSADTTNGTDGTWSTEIADYPDHGYDEVYAKYRDNIQSLAASSKRAIRMHLSGGFSNEGTIAAMHVYGEIAAAQTPDRLLFIDETTGLEYTAARDWGDVPRGGSEDDEWRIRNNSATLTANTIQYTAEALYLGSGAWYTYTLPSGSIFQATQQIASLAPATTTGIIKNRRIIPAIETVGLHAGRTYLNVDTWT